MSVNAKSIKTNFKIKAPKIRLIGSDGTQIGVVTVLEGVKRAQEEGLDLVEISPTAVPPVCRITDFGKYVYSLNKKDKESKKKQRVINIKEVKMSSKIEEHDYQTKLRNSHKFLSRGDKVKLTMFFRGREITHTDIGQRIIDRFISDLSDVGEVERNAGLEGKTIQLYLTPVTGQKKTAVKESSEEEKGSKNAED